MNTFYTSVLERRALLSGDFVTVPYECGWAREALLFVTVERCEGTDTRLSLRVQISPDGIHWVDEGTVCEHGSEPSTRFVRVTQFGGWLRVAGTVSGTAAVVRGTIHLALKA